MWDVVGMARSNCSIVLTTHSMEECEALCTRVAVMTAGRLRCLGSPQHLKVQYGGGYHLELRVQPTAEVLECVCDRVASMLPGSRLVERHEGRFKFTVEAEVVCLAEIFEQIEVRRE